MFPTITRLFTQFLQTRSPRERVLLAVAVSALLVIGVLPVVTSPIIEAFQLQTMRVEELNKSYTSTPDILTRYAKLSARRSEVEAFYDKVDLSANPLSYLEGLLREQAKAADGYNVTPREDKQIGSKYTHKTFSVMFQTVSMDALANFLKALTTGEQPMLVTQITLSKRNAGEVLNVQLEVSAFEPIKSAK
jgi:type II secretory pathway component PulM